MTQLVFDRSSDTYNVSDLVEYPFRPDDLPRVSLGVESLRLTGLLECPHDQRLIHAEASEEVRHLLESPIRSNADVVSGCDVEEKTVLRHPFQRNETQVLEEDVVGEQFHSQSSAIVDVSGRHRFQFLILLVIFKPTPPTLRINIVDHARYALEFVEIVVLLIPLL